MLAAHLAFNPKPPPASNSESDGLTSPGVETPVVVKKLSLLFRVVAGEDNGEGRCPALSL